MNSCTNSTCNIQVGSPNLFSNAVEYSNYDYLVNGASTYVFLALFSCATVLHVLLGVYWRRWWTIYTLCIGSALESIGWGGRYWSYRTTVWQAANGGIWDSNTQGFIMQIVCLIIAPTFFSAANYIFLGSLVTATGSQYSSITPSSFSKMFTFADFICLLIQCIGGGMVGTATTGDGMKRGLHVMSAGVIAQLVLTVIFSVLFAEFAWRYAQAKAASRVFNLLGWTRIFKRKANKHKSAETLTMSTLNDNNLVQPDQLNVKASSRKRSIVWGQWALLASNLLVFARSLYRAVELLGYSPENPGAYADQNLFLAMDASLMLVVLVVYIVVHPGQVDGRALF